MRGKTVAEVSNSFIPNYTLEICEGCCLDTTYGTSATEIPTVAE
jgi:hypothetical protein